MTEQYQQRALPLESTPSPDEHRRPAEPTRSPARPRSASDRLPDDLWDEYRFECETRDRLDLPRVSLDEFQDMRDFSDGITVYLDIEKPEPPYERTKTE